MEEEVQAAPAKAGKIGCGTIIAFVLVAFILLAIGSNAALGYYFSRCNDLDIFECFLNQAEDEKPAGTVVATGVYSYDKYSVTLKANIPLEGGAVTGIVSGTCEGMLKGTFNGQNNGQLSGTIAASCSPFFVNIPASATFSGVVNKDNKTVPINFVGEGAGMKREGSMSLAY